MTGLNGEGLARPPPTMCTSPACPPHPLQTLGKRAPPCAQHQGPLQAPLPCFSASPNKSYPGGRMPGHGHSPHPQGDTAPSSLRGVTSPRVDRPSSVSPGQPWLCQSCSGDPGPASICRLQPSACSNRGSRLRSFPFSQDQLPPGTPSPVASSHPQETEPQCRALGCVSLSLGERLCYVSILTVPTLVS